MPLSEVQNVFREYAGFELDEDELHALYNCKNYKNSPIPEDERSADGVEPSLYSGSLTSFMAKLITSKTCFGFTTGGHTGEEVFLSVYHPQGTIPVGMNTNIELNEYMCALFGISGQLEPLTNRYFAPHTEVFSGFDCKIIPGDNEDDFPLLVVKNKKKQLNISPFTNLVTQGKKGGEEIRIPSVVVYVDANNTFYLPRQLADYLK